VRVLRVQARQNSGRADVEFLDDQEPGRTESVRVSRLRVPWDQVAVFDELMANWARLDDLDLDETEQAAVEQVYLLLIPDRVAEWEWSPVRFATAVHDREALAAVLGVSLEDIVARCESFELDGDLMLSPAGSLVVAEAACCAAAMPVLDWVIGEERQIREKVKRGGRRTSVVERKEVETSPEWEYHWYRARDRPLHELLRQWCGHRAVSFQERLIAAEAENHRLDVLVAELIDALRHAGSEHAAAAFEEEHERDRVTPPKSRPVIDRPLDISEILSATCPPAVPGHAEDQGRAEPAASGVALTSAGARGGPSRGCGPAATHRHGSRVGTQQNSAGFHGTVTGLPRHAELGDSSCTDAGRTGRDLALRGTVKQQVRGYTDVSLTRWVGWAFCKPSAQPTLVRTQHLRHNTCHYERKRPVTGVPASRRAALGLGHRF
jgi:hypothetical protein